MKARFLSSDELQRLQAACSFDDWLPFEIALQTGMRIGDVLCLQAQNIGCGEIRYTAQKTGKHGVAPCDRELCDIVRRGKRLGEFVFPGKRVGTHLTRQQAWNRIKSAAKRAKINPEGVSPHALRKSFAVRLYQREGLEAVQNALQHNRVSTTEIYTLSDWISGENARLPLTRADIPYIVERVFDALKCRIDNRADL